MFFIVHVTFLAADASITEQLVSPQLVHLYKKQKISLKNKKDLGMACHTPPLKKVKKQCEMLLPILGPIPLKQVGCFISKNQPGLRRSDPHRQAKLCWFNSDSVDTTSIYLLASGVSAVCQPRVVVSTLPQLSRYPSRSRNFGRLLIAATQSSRLNC